MLTWRVKVCSSWRFCQIYTCILSQSGGWFAWQFCLSTLPVSSKRWALPAQLRFRTVSLCYCQVQSASDQLPGGFCAMGRALGLLFCGLTVILGTLPFSFVLGNSVSPCVGNTFMPLLKGGCYHPFFKKCCLNLFERRVTLCLAYSPDGCNDWDRARSFFQAFCVGAQV